MVTTSGLHSRIGRSLTFQNFRTSSSYFSRLRSDGRAVRLSDVSQSMFNQTLACSRPLQSPEIPSLGKAICSKLSLFHPCITLVTLFVENFNSNKQLKDRPSDGLTCGGGMVEWLARSEGCWFESWSAPSCYVLWQGTFLHIVSLTPVYKLVAAN